MKYKVFEKVVLFALMAGFLCIAGTWGCGKSGPSSKVPKIAIVEDKAVQWADEVKEGFKVGLLRQGVAVETVFRSAKGNPQSLSTIAEEVTKGNYQLIFTLGTQATEAVVPKLKNTPLIFGAVTDPVGAGLFDKDLQHPLGDITGTQTLWPYKAQFDMMKTLFPKLKKIGIVFNPDESNSRASVEYVREQCRKRKITLVERPATTATEIRNAVNALFEEKIDLLFIPQDNTVQASSRDIIDLCRKKRVPVFTGICEIVEHGALAAVGVDYYELGTANAGQAAEILFHGKKAAEMPVVVSEKGHFCFNARTARNLGIVVPEDIEKSAFKIYEPQ